MKQKIVRRTLWALAALGLCLGGQNAAHALTSNFIAYKTDTQTFDDGDATILESASAYHRLEYYASGRTFLDVSRIPRTRPYNARLSTRCSNGVLRNSRTDNSRSLFYVEHFCGSNQAPIRTEGVLDVR